MPADLPPPIPHSIPWAELRTETFKVDVLRCPRCDGRLAIIAFITDVIVVHKILAHLKLPTTLDPPLRSRFDEQLSFDFAGTGDANPAREQPCADRAAGCRDPP